MFEGMLWDLWQKLEILMLCLQQIKIGYEWISCLITRLVRSKVCGQRAFSSHLVAFAQSCAPARTHQVPVLRRTWLTAGVGVTKHLSGALPGTRRHMETLSWWAAMCQVCRATRIEEVASFKQPFMALPQKVHQTCGHPEPDPQELHYLELLVCPCIFIGTPAFICQRCIWYHEQHGLMARNLWMNFIL